MGWCVYVICIVWLDSLHEGTRIRCLWPAPLLQLGSWRCITVHIKEHLQRRQLTRNVCVLITVVISRLFFISSARVSAKLFCGRFLIFQGDGGLLGLMDYWKKNLAINSNVLTLNTIHKTVSSSFSSSKPIKKKWTV